MKSHNGGLPILAETQRCRPGNGPYGGRRQSRWLLTWPAALLCLGCSTLQIKITRRGVHPSPASFFSHLCSDVDSPFHPACVKAHVSSAYVLVTVNRPSSGNTQIACERCPEATAVTWSFVFDACKTLAGLGRGKVANCGHATCGGDWGEYVR